METEWAWAAGLFEGEGAITSCRGRPRLAVKMCDREPLERFAKLTGGRLYGPYANDASSRQTGYSHRPFSMVVLERQAARDAFEKMRPWLSAYRLRRFTEVFATVETGGATAIPARKPTT